MHPFRFVRNTSEQSVVNFVREVRAHIGLRVNESQNAYKSAYAILVTDGVSTTIQVKQYSAGNFEPVDRLKVLLLTVHKGMTEETLPGMRR